jgi:hypothetical protein
MTGGTGGSGFFNEKIAKGTAGVTTDPPSRPHSRAFQASNLLTRLPVVALFANSLMMNAGEKDARRPTPCVVHDAPDIERGLATPGSFISGFV